MKHLIKECRYAMTALRAVAALILILTVALAGGPPTSAQSARSSGDIQVQIQKSAALQRQALASLADATRAERLIHDAYSALRSGLSTMVSSAAGARFQDPLLVINTKNAERALSLLQAAEDALKTNQPGAAVPPVVRANLEQALRLTNAIVVY